MYEDILIKGLKADTLTKNKILNSSGDPPPPRSLSMMTTHLNSALKALTISNLTNDKYMTDTIL